MMRQSVRVGESIMWITSRRAIPIMTVLLAALVPNPGAAQDGGRIILEALKPQPRPDPGEVPALIRAYNASGQALFKDFAAGPGNIVFSPYSIGTAMAMALAG